MELPAAGRVRDGRALGGRAQDQLFSKHDAISQVPEFHLVFA
jgi:hypothetical protein